MFRSVKSCVYYSVKENKELKIELNKKEAVIIKSDLSKKLFNKNQKQLSIEYIQALDVFFGRYDMTSWKTTDDDSDRITVQCDNDIFTVSLSTLSPNDVDLFADVSRYLNAVFDGTLETESLSFHSFDGGGPEYSMETEIKGIFTWFSKRVYSNPDHEKLCGSGFNVYFTLYPLRPGKATAVITGNSPICPEPKRRLFVEVDNNLHITKRLEVIDEVEL